MGYVRSKIFGHNGKMETTEESNPGTAFYNFNTPPGVTCPQAGRCFTDRWCYALNGRYTFPTNKKRMQTNYELSKTDTFVETITEELQRLQRLQPEKKIYIRWNDAGDIYSTDYFRKLVKIASLNPDINFYSYTKSIGLVKEEMKSVDVPANYHIIFSWGGKQDHLITPDDRQAKIFETPEQADAMWNNAAHNDIVAYQSDRTCLPYHGQRKWTHD